MSGAVAGGPARGSDTIRTARLDLVPMTHAFLEATLAGDRARQAAVLGAAVAPDWPDETGWVARWRDALFVEPALAPWLSRAMVLRSERRMVGNIGFHGRPGAAALEVFAPGGVEFGYTVSARDRRQGFAREAASGLIAWARALHGISHFAVSIRPDNAPSLAVARSLGFVRVGSHVDEEDGPEDVFVLRFPA